MPLAVASVTVGVRTFVENFIDDSGQVIGGEETEFFTEF